MTESDQEKTIEERYELLQGLCKQQMLINEALKTELLRLGEIYQKVSKERNLLLTELLENHSSCANAVLTSDTSDYMVPCFPKRRCVIDPVQEIPRRTEAVCSSPDRKLTIVPQPTKSSASGPHGDDSVGCESDTWMEHDPFTPFDQRERASPVVLSATAAAPARSSASRLQNLAAHLNSPPSLTVKDQPSVQNCNWQQQQQYTNPGSPPALTVSTSSVGNPNTARSLKAASLVTSSSVSSSPGIPFVPFSGHKSSTAGLQGMKSISFSSRPVCGPQSTHLSRPGAPISVVLNTTASNVSGQPTLLGTKVQSSPQGSTSLRLACSTSGQRILIQPASTTSRPVIVQSTENHSSGVAGNSQ